MPLIKCPSCEADVSSEAKACPKCGHPLNKAKARPLGKIILLLVLVGLLVVVAKLSYSDTHRFEKHNAELGRQLQGLVECNGTNRRSPWGIKHCP